MQYLFILLISILYTILFFGKVKGLSMIIFTLIFLLFTYYYLKKINLIKNKKAFIYIIPIILLSLTYLIFDNSMFSFFNYYGIILLYNYMVLSVTNKMKDFYNLFRNSIKLIFDSIRNSLRSFSEAIKILKNKINLKVNDKVYKYLKSIILTIVILIIIIALLTSADLIFKSIFSNISSLISDVLDQLFSSTFIYKLIYTFIVFIIISGMFYSIVNVKAKKYEVKNIKLENLTVKMILISLNVIYLIFCFIQIKSLFLKDIPSNYIYSSYAREGFFQLLAVSIINIILILISKKSSSGDKFITNNTFIMIVFNSIIVFSSFYRMYLYESQYGYTSLRLLVYCFLVLEIILFIPTILFIFDKKFDLMKVYFNIFIIWYVIINFMNFDYIISYNNVNRYLDGRVSEEKFDVSYLVYSAHSSSVNNILKLDGKLKDKYNISDIKYYKEIIIASYSRDIREFNVSKYMAYKKLKKTYSK